MANVVPFYFSKHNRQPRPGVLPDLGHPQCRGLEAWWPLVEGGGSVVHDVSGFRPQSGTLTNMDPTTDWSGIFESGLHLFRCPIFTPDNQSINVTSHRATTRTYPYTVTLWACFNGANTDWDNDSPFTFWGDASNYIMLRMSGDGTGAVWHWEKKPWEANGVSSDLSVVKDEWTHLAWFHDGSNCGLYINGNKQTSTMAFSSTITVNNIYIGSQDGATGNFAWEGGISDVRIYNRNLTKAEILEIYHRPFAAFRT